MKKNRKKIDPRYFLAETAVRDDLDDMLSPKETISEIGAGSGRGVGRALATGFAKMPPGVKQVAMDAANEVFALFDPTGISSWDGVEAAKAEYNENPDDIMKAGMYGIELLGAIPFLGKGVNVVKVPAKLAKYVGLVSKLARRSGTPEAATMATKLDDLARTVSSPRVRGAAHQRDLRAARKALKTKPEMPAVSSLRRRAADHQRDLRDARKALKTKPDMSALDPRRFDTFVDEGRSKRNTLRESAMPTPDSIEQLVSSLTACVGDDPISAMLAMAKCGPIAATLMQQVQVASGSEGLEKVSAWLNAMKTAEKLQRCVPRHCQKAAMELFNTLQMAHKMAEDSGLGER